MDFLVKAMRDGVTLFSHRDHVEAEEEKMDELSILLFNAGLDDYEESIRAKAITTPEELEKMDERDVRKLIAKPVHARKMLDLIKGRKLRSVSVKFSRPWAANARRAPTPDGALKKRIKSENVAAEATFPGGLTAMDSAKYATVRVDDGTLDLEIGCSTRLGSWMRGQNLE